MITNSKLVRPIAMLLFGLVTAAGTASAQDDGPIMEQLGLSKQQRDQIASLTDAFLRETTPLRSDIRRLVEEEKRLKAAASPNEAALRRKLQERADKEIDLSLALTRFHERVEAVLTVPQRKKMAELKKQSDR